MSPCPQTPGGEPTPRQDERPLAAAPPESPSRPAVRRRLQVGETLEQVQNKCFDRGHAQCTGDFSCPVTTHAVGDQKEVAPIAAMLCRRLWQTCLPDPERAGQLRNEEVILVGIADPAPVGQAVAMDGNRGRRGLDHGMHASGVECGMGWSFRFPGGGSPVSSVDSTRFSVVMPAWRWWTWDHRYNLP